jgi:hypothetical protein
VLEGSRDGGMEKTMAKVIDGNRIAEDVRAEVKAQAI